MTADSPSASRPPFLPAQPGWPLLCLVTDRARFERADNAAACDALVAQAGEAAEAGIDIIQIRERGLDDRTLLQLVERMCAAIAGSHTRIVVNDRVDIALVAGAHGVHLRESSYAAVHARALLGPPALIGRSVHDEAQARGLDLAGDLDYLIFGTVFTTSSKPAGHPVAGLDALSGVVRACRRPVLAIGGIDVDNVGAVARTGAAGVAAIGLFLGSRSPGARAALSLRQAAERVRLAFVEHRAR